MQGSQKPESALKRAQELLEADRRDTALTVLSSVLVRKNKGKHVWQPELEDVTKLYLEICVKAHDHHMAKDGLHQFRSICQVSNMYGALENVIQDFLAKAIERTAQVQEEAEKLIVEAEANPKEETPESLLIKSVNGYDARERIEKEMVFPWLKFMWESFRAVLELIKNKSKLETLYQTTTKLTIEHCIKYKRPTEFKRLNDLLRSHLTNMNKFPSPQGGPPMSLSSADSQQVLFETRFNLLEAAMQMELWQEAFKCVEDINELVVATKRTPSLSSMQLYYQSLATLFWKSKNYLFHAYALFKYYHVVKASQKEMSAECLEKLSSTLLIAILASPLSAADHQFLEYKIGQQERYLKYAFLLGSPSAITRESLVAEFTFKGLQNHTSPIFRDLIHIMEEKFSPLELCNSVKPKLDAIKETDYLNQYLPLFKQAVFVRLLQQLTRVYQTMTLARLNTLVSQLDMDSPIETIIVECVANKLVEARLEHQRQAIKFGCLVLESNLVRNQLTTFSKSLRSAVEVITPCSAEAQQERKAKSISAMAQRIEKERAEVFHRKSIIEAQKENQEMVDRLKSKLTSLKRELEIAKRPKPEPVAPTPAKTLEEVTPEPVPVPVTIKPQSVRSVVPGMIPVEETETVQTSEEKKAAAAKEAADKASALKEKLDKIAQRIDYLERARREEEAPLLREWYTKYRDESKVIFEKDIKEFMENKKKEHEFMLKEKERLNRLAPYLNKFTTSVIADRKIAFEAMVKDIEQNNDEIQKLIEEEKEVIKRQIRERRQEETRRRKMREAAEREKQRQEEAHRLQREKERQKEEERRIIEERIDAPKFRGPRDSDRPVERGSRFGQPRDDDERPRFGGDGPRRFGGGRHGDEDAPRRFGRGRDDYDDRDDHDFREDRPRRGFGASRFGDDEPPRRFGRGRDDYDDEPPRRFGRGRDDDDDHDDHDDAPRRRFGGGRFGGDSDDRPPFRNDRREDYNDERPPRDNFREERPVSRFREDRGSEDRFREERPPRDERSPRDDRPTFREKKFGFDASKAEQTRSDEVQNWRNRPGRSGRDDSERAERSERPKFGSGFRRQNQETKRPEEEPASSAPEQDEDGFTLVGGRRKGKRNV